MALAFEIRVFGILLMKSKLWWLALPLVCVVVFSTCSGGGGGGSSFHYPAPVLLAVSFVGSGADPVAGDSLRLVMSEAVTIAAGAELEKKAGKDIDGEQVAQSAAISRN